VVTGGASEEMSRTVGETLASMDLSRFQTERSALRVAVVVGVAGVCIAALVFRQLSTFVIGVGVVLGAPLTTRNARPRARWYLLSLAVAGSGIAVWSQARSSFWHDGGTVFVIAGIVGFVDVVLLRLSHNPGATS
jgi:disulfide bond formation protein DsbB